MLQNQMPALTWNNMSLSEELCESYAFTYLAKYNAADWAARSLQSFYRAFAPSDVQRVARVDGGKPSYVIAFWDYGIQKRMLVAIEGLTSRTQLNPLLVGPNSTSMNPLPGFCYGAFKTFAEAIAAELLARTDFLSYWNTAGCQVTFAGFSLGAAVAEIIAVKMALLKPTAHIGIVKFGAPRTGDLAWVQGPVSQIPTSCVYVGADKIDVIPYVTAANLQFQLFVFQTFVTNYAANPSQLRFDMSGRFSNDFNETGFVEYRRAITDLARTVDDTNRWWYHAYDAYRLALLNLAIDQQSSAEWRFRYLEFNDDNQWQTLFRTGLTDYTGLVGLVDPNPADFVNDLTPQQARTAERAIAAPQLIPSPMQGLPVAPPIPARPRGMWIPRRVRDL